VLDETETLTEPRVARDLSARLAHGSVLVVASSMPIRDLDVVMPEREGLDIVANRGVSGIDGFVSTAMAVATARAGRTWALAGDLSMLHDVNGLLADPSPDVTFVVVNNDGGGIFSLLPQGAAADATFERVFGTPHGVDVAAAAAAYGAKTARLSTATELAAAIAMPPSGVTVLEVRTDRDANAKLHRRLSEAAADALHRWMSAS
jgi:2-succinyl-5-enolpyruvyl-6-hydroxy-3-cyclohexene-1-carboxylate synthase